MVGVNMDNTSRELNCPIEVKTEIFGDMMFFSYILSVQRRMENVEAKQYINQFLRILAPIYCHEFLKVLKQANQGGSIEKLDKRILNFIALKRNRTIKDVIVESKKVQSVEQYMGLNYKEKVYDMTLLLKEDELLDMNFESFIAPIENEEMWEIMFAIPIETVNILFKPCLMELSQIFSDDILKRIASHWDESLVGERYCYSVFKLFPPSHKLDRIDKIFIIYRYRMISSILRVQKLYYEAMQPLGIYSCLNLDYFFRKYRSLIIEIVGKELQLMNTPFSQKIENDFSKAIAPNFFPLNRKLRNNLHYGSISGFTEDEMLFLDQNQSIYLNILMKHIRSNIVIDIDDECKFMTRFSRAYSESGISQDEFEKNYRNYYNSFLRTGRFP